ncbi:MAG: UDP-galactopyranose mutase, partial [Deltaproteobacteria bacterium]
MTFSYDILVVGSGWAGATVARKLADEGLRVLVLERRNHIGGNCYDEY